MMRDIMIGGLVLSMCANVERMSSGGFITNHFNFRTMIGKTVKYRDKIYQVAQWIHYRLEWFEVELKDHRGYHKFWLKESDVIVF